jgi:sugar/nucleoside kinase (ribokinase family)
MSSGQSIDILGLGAVAVDDLLYVDEYPAAERKVRVRHRLRQCGGLTGTALVAAARLGARCGYAGVLGDDELSRFAMDCLQREGVDLSHRVPRPDAVPAYSTIVVDETRHTRTIFSSVAGAIGADPRLPEPDVIRSASVLLVDHHGLEGTLRATRIARDAGRSVVADFERNPGSPFSELLALVDHLLVSERFARELSGDPNASASELASRLWTPARRTVVITCGAEGGWYRGQSDPVPQHYSAFQVNVLDTTGCGDVFHGAYAAALAEGRDLEQRVRFASAAAALKATERGGQAGCPSRAAVKEFLESISR